MADADTDTTIYSTTPLSSKYMISPTALLPYILLFLFGLFLCVTYGRPYLIFCYNCFIKPLSGKNGQGTQQEVLESFYRGQAAIYDTTREGLLRGRIEMLKISGAHLILKSEKEGQIKKRIWVDIGGGTGYNIEKMNEILPLQDYFSAIFLVDFSPSLCDIAKKRFTRLGFQNVQVICMDARKFRLGDFIGEKNHEGADWITLSYSLSMIPDFYSVVDSLTSLLSPTGLISVADFYVQSSTSLTARTYIGGQLSRHVNWFSRTFWRIWFEFDRVHLDEGRRDYLEYRFGTIASLDQRNRLLGGIPYYIWLGCSKQGAFETKIEQLDAAATESPYLSPTNYKNARNSKVQADSVDTVQKLRSKGFEAAIINLSTNLPLPSCFYQNHIWRLYYDELHPKHTQFNNDYIYAFTWEDPRVDQRILNVNSDDIVLAITSAGDNILSYIADGSPKRIHAVDMNPAQNHLLELKLAAFASGLSRDDIWKLFGEGRHSNFKDLLISRLSPHLSSNALQFWFANTNRFKSGLYESGGSRIAIKATRWLFSVFGLTNAVEEMCCAKTLNEQKEIWEKKLRPVILSWWVSWAIIGNERFLWKALGVPPNQRDMIYADYHCEESSSKKKATDRGGKAMWEYVVNTLDPVVNNSLIANDNYFYLLCLKGCYTSRCQPTYLSENGYKRLTRPNVFEGVRIHTDGISEVLAHIQPGTLTKAVIMDSMDWFEVGGVEARKQIKALNKAMKLKGKVMFRSAGLKPWYASIFEEEGFEMKRVCTRLPGNYIDRVNMYASTWIGVKVENCATATSIMIGTTQNYAVMGMPSGMARSRSSSLDTICEADRIEI